MSKGKGPSEKLEKEEVLKAVLVADDFDDVFGPFLHHGCSALLPIASKKSLEYALETLSQAGVQETILFCSTKADVIKDFIRCSRWGKPGSSMSIVVLVSERCMSLGDALRDIDNKALVKHDFILLSTSTISNIQLQDVLKFHKNQTKKDRGSVMTLILQDRGFGSISEETVVAFNSKTDRLLIYAKDATGSKIDVPMEFFVNHPEVTMSCTLKDTGVAICSPSVPLLFSDNFDFQSIEDFIKGLLINEETLDSRIYCHVTRGYGHTIKGWSSYQRVTSDIIHRWTYPLVPDVHIGKSETLIHQRGCVYKHPGVSLSKGCKLDMNVIIGRGCKFGSNVQLLRCVIGEDCDIGDNVVIRDSFLLDGVTVANDTSISLSVLGDNVKVGAWSSLKNCRLHQGVILDGDAEVDDKEITSSHVAGCEKLGESAFVLPASCPDDNSDDGVTTATGTWLKDPDITVEEIPEASSVSDSEESRSVSPEADDCSVFYSEVVDSLQRGFEEKLPCTNLILEVNSSRFAYNVTPSEVTQLTSKAVFVLPARLQKPAKPVLNYFKPLFENYIKTEDGQRECLTAFEEAYESLGNEVNGCLHYLYDSDILTEEIIDEWYQDLDDESEIKPKLAKFMQWLSEAAEESDD